MAKLKRYYSYLLRMWQTGDGPGCTWCASLEQPGTGERRGFATLDQLFAYLRDQTALQPGQAGLNATEKAGASKEVKPSEARRGKERQG
jgi:hypothetical protein